jgi:ferritin-like metal-binding protein YciE
VLWIERTLAFEVLPQAVERVRDEELRGALAAHLEETRSHVARVESAFRAAGADAVAARSAGLAGLKAHHESQEAKELTLRDLLDASASIRVEHLELAVYGSLLGLAKPLDLGESAGLLAENRKEEDKALDRLEGIADRLRKALPGA